MVNSKFPLPSLNRERYRVLWYSQKGASLLAVVHDWLQALESDKEIIAIFIDLRKAFHSVPHARNLAVQDSINIIILMWIQSYLTHRSQRVVISDESSPLLPLLSSNVFLPKLALLCNSYPICIFQVTALRKGSWTCNCVYSKIILLRCLSLHFLLPHGQIHHMPKTVFNCRVFKRNKTCISL